MNMTDCKDWFTFMVMGLMIESTRKFPTLSYSTNAVSNRQIKRQITSITLSTITVPSKLLNGIFSALLKDPQRLTSPKRDNSQVGKVSNHEEIHCICGFRIITQRFN